MESCRLLLESISKLCFVCTHGVSSVTSFGSASEGFDGAGLSGEERLWPLLVGHCGLLG